MKELFIIKVIYRDDQFVAQISSNISGLEDKTPIGSMAKTVVAGLNRYMKRLSGEKKQQLINEICPHELKPTVDTAEL